MNDKPMPLADKLAPFHNPVPRMGPRDEPLVELLARVDADIAAEAQPSLSQLLTELTALQSRQHKETTELTTKIIAKLNSINSAIR
jgi:hypothetical protein